MRRLAGAGFKVALSETGTLPPGVQDDWLGEAMREDFAARLAAANAAIVSSPDDPDLHAEKGALQLARGRYREAAASFAAALAIDGADPSAWRGLGDALLRMGRSEAEVAFERAERPVPVSPEAAARDPVVRTALEMVPPPVREVSCQACGGRQGAWIDPDLYRCQACGRVSDPSSPSGPTSTGGRQ
jgi:tetratricopeptide (TPR) repeat protein